MKLQWKERGRQKQVSIEEFPCKVGKIKEEVSTDIEIPMLPITSLIQELQFMGYDDIVAGAIISNLQSVSLEIMLKNSQKLHFLKIF